MCYWEKNVLWDRERERQTEIERKIPLVCGDRNCVSLPSSPKREGYFLLLSIASHKVRIIALINQAAIYLVQYFASSSGQPDASPIYSREAIDQRQDTCFARRIFQFR